MAIQNSNQQGIQKRLIPPGGTAGQIPSKKTAADYDVQWVDPPEGGGGSTGGGIPAGVIVIWSGASDAVPNGWALCDGTNGTPDLRDRFVLGAGTSHAVGSSGGSEEVKLTLEQMPSHNHTIVTNGTVENIANRYRINTTFSRNSDAYGVTVTSVMSNSGSSQPHDNMPPYYTLAYIMKL